MTQADKTEAVIDSSVVELDFELATKEGLFAEVNSLRNHARDLARKLDDIRLYAWQQNDEDVQEHINAILEAE